MGAVTVLLAVLAAQDSERLIEDLGSPEIEVRDRATCELRRRLPGVEPLLRKNAAHPDAEIAARCRDLLAGPPKPPSPAGVVALVDEKRGLAALSLRAKDGLRAGDQVLAAREGRSVGVLEISDVQLWGSWARPKPGTNITDLQKGDVVLVVESRK
jgi:hypothetical protein